MSNEKELMCEHGVGQKYENKRGGFTGPQMHLTEAIHQASRQKAGL